LLDNKFAPSHFLTLPLAPNQDPQINNVHY